MKIKVTLAISQGDQCAVHVEARGTHSGDGLGVAATHRPVHFAGIVIVRARDGKLVEGLNAFDFLSLYQQIGLVPPMGQTISL
jgi:predicted ester cyclase